MARKYYNNATSLEDYITDNSKYRTCYAVRIDLPHPNPTNYSTVTHRLWTENYDVGQYVGAGDLLHISSLSETSELTASGLSISLVGTPDMLTILRDRRYQGGLVEAFVGFVTIDNNQRRYYPKLIKFFEGFADQMLFSMSEEAVMVTLKAENKLIRLSKSSNRYYTHEDQVLDYPDDKGFEFQNFLQDREVLWGRL